MYLQHMMIVVHIVIWQMGFILDVLPHVSGLGQHYEDIGLLTH